MSVPAVLIVVALLISICVAAAPIDNLGVVVSTFKNGFRLPRVESTCNPTVLR